MIGNTARLLHVVGNDDDGVILFEFASELFNFEGGNGVKGGGGLIHQNDVWLNCQGASDAQTLLLTARETHGALFEAIFELIPDRGLTKAPFHNFIKHRLVFDPVDAWAISDVIIYAFGKGIGLLKDHPNLTAQSDGIQISIDIYAIKQNFAFHTGIGHEVIHTVEGF